MALPIISWTGLDTTHSEQVTFRSLNQETRDVALSSLPSGEGLSGFDFAGITRDTIWISRGGYTGLAFTATEQEDIESTLRTGLLSTLQQSLQPVIYRAEDGDAIPWLAGHGPTRDGLILITKAAQAAVTSYDADGNGAVERADVLITGVSAPEILRGVLSALAAPQPVIASATPDQSILHPQSILTALTVMDTKLLRIAASMTPGQPFENYFRIPV